MNEAALRAYQPKPVDPQKIHHIHFIAVAGTGMGTLAGMLKESGYHVTGSDLDMYPPMSDQLQAWNIPVKKGFQPENLDPRPDLVIVGNAVRPSNPEFQAAIERKIPCTSMPRAIHDFFLKDREVVVIAGTHGKTTTTALTGWLLEYAGLKPGILVGGVSANFNGSYRLPSPESRYFVIEGDEYDSALFDKVPKFVHYAPKYVVLTSVEFDHADIYDNINEVKAAFQRLMQKLNPEGHLWVSGDYELALSISRIAKTHREIYGTSPQYDFYADGIQTSKDGVSFELFRKEESLGQFLLPMFGRYNVSNAVAAIGVALKLGVSLDKIREGLASFKGIRRRQEIVGTVGDIVVIDDFAHHPTAIEVTSQGIRERYPDRRIWGIFEPRSNTARRNFFQEQLPKSFQYCDQIVLAWPFQYDKMGAAERLDIHKVIEDLKKLDKEAIAFPSVDQIVAYVTAKARPDDVFLIMSNGGFENIHQKLLDTLSTRFA